jgi:hypothetical protein
MSLHHSLGDLLDQHITLELECIDRMYLNVYVAKLQTESQVAGFLKKQRGALLASSALMEPITKAFVSAIDRFVHTNNIPVVRFGKGQRKDDIAKEYLAKFDRKEGVLFLGKAQEKNSVFRTEKRRNDATGRVYPWIVRSSAMVNCFYFYCVDEDFGPFFLKYCGYFPYNAKLCINGHEYLKRQLDKEGIAYEPLDNGILSCADPVRMQQIADELSAEKIADLAHKWQQLLPFPFTAEDAAAGYQYRISILQAEFSRTQIFDRPLSGRLFFEQVIRENLDCGRPDRVQLVFLRRISKRTPGIFRTRVITEGVTPSLHLDYKHTRLKQYYKEGRGLRTEATFNDTRDFGIGKSLVNLPALREIGFSACRRLLEVERLSHDCSVGHETLQCAQAPKVVESQRTSGLRLGDPKAQSLLQALLAFRLHVNGFTNRELREVLAPLLGMDPASMSAGRMTYQLRRLKLHGLIQRIPRTHRYKATDLGIRLSLFYTRTYSRLLAPAATLALDAERSAETDGRDCFARLAAAVDACCRACNLAA